MDFQPCLGRVARVAREALRRQNRLNFFKKIDFLTQRNGTGKKNEKTHPHDSEFIRTEYRVHGVAAVRRQEPRSAKMPPYLRAPII